MCGIAGVRKFGEKPITGEELVLLLCDLEHRGNHATGVALENPDGLHVLKMAKPAAFFTRSDEFADFIDAHLTPETRTALLHTRWATVGSPLINANNHPMFDGNTAAVHNGHISNHTWLFQGDYKRSCETDSDIIRAIVAKHGITPKAIRELGKMSGSAAIAVLSNETPDKLLLARSGSPLVYGINEDKMYWASEAHAITKAARPYKKIHGVWVQDTHVNLSIGSMPDNTAWVIGPEGLEAHFEFPVCYSYHAPDYSKGRENYHSKSKQWKRERRQENSSKRIGFASAASSAFVTTQLPEKHSVASCPSCGRGVLNKDGVAWATLICPHCKSKMA